MFTMLQLSVEWHSQNSQPSMLFYKGKTKLHCTKTHKKLAKVTSVVMLLQRQEISHFFHIYTNISLESSFTIIPFTMFWQKLQKILQDLSCSKLDTGSICNFR